MKRWLLVVALPGIRISGFCLLSQRLEDLSRLGTARQQLHLHFLGSDLRLVHQRPNYRYEHSSLPGWHDDRRPLLPGRHSCDGARAVKLCDGHLHGQPVRDGVCLHLWHV